MLYSRMKQTQKSVKPLPVHGLLVHPHGVSCPPGDAGLGGEDGGEYQRETVPFAVGALTARATK